MKTLLVTAGAGMFAVLLGLAWSTVGSGGEVLEHNGIRLVIPEQYLAKERFPPWIRQVPGLDSDKGGALVRIPVEEIKSFLPESNLEPFSGSTLIQIYGPGEAERATTRAAEHANKINSRQDEYAEIKVIEDKPTGWYRLYDRYDEGGSTTTWEIVKRPPPLAPDDVVAECIRHEKTVITDCRLPTFNINGVAVGMSVREEHLLYYERFKQHIAKLLRSWRVESKPAAAT